MNMKEFLCPWYQKNKRDLPWRKTNDPYAIWISEIMLQQTQVQTVIPYYQRFMERFPTVEDLANAPLETVYKYWEGLGYYRRAKHLHEAANDILTHWNGHFPNHYKDLLTLKGIGPYTASAIASIAFLEPKGVVDGNVLRIMARYDGSEANIALEKTKRDIQKRVDTLIIGANPSDFNQGLMDLGATICKPQHPLCHQCPLQQQCQAYRTQKQKVLPVVRKKRQHSEEHYLTVILKKDDRIFLTKNTEGLLENLYALPQYDLESPHAFEELFKETYGLEIQVYEHVGEVKHVFSHKTWRMHVYLATLVHKELNHPQFLDVHQVPMATAHKKILMALEKDS